jgi:hypothetical protein
MEVLTGRLDDGTVLGRDTDGTIHVGTPRRVTWDQVTRDVTEVDGRYDVVWHVNGHVISRGTYEPLHTEDSGRVDADGNPVYINVGLDPDAPAPPVPDRTWIDGDGVQHSAPRTVEVIDWEPANG